MVIYYAFISAKDILLWLCCNVLIEHSAWASPNYSYFINLLPNAVKIFISICLEVHSRSLCFRFSVFLAWFSVHFASREQESLSKLWLTLHFICHRVHSIYADPAASSVLLCVHTSGDTVNGVIHFQWELEIYSNCLHNVVLNII